MPMVWDNYDMDKLVREVGQINGIDPELMLSTDARDAKRQAMQEAQEQQLKMEQIERATQVAKTGSEVDKNRAEGESLRGS